MRALLPGLSGNTIYHRYVIRLKLSSTHSLGCSAAFSRHHQNNGSLGIPGPWEIPYPPSLNGTIAWHRHSTFGWLLHHCPAFSGCSFLCVLVVIYKCTVFNPFNFNAAWNADGESKRTNTLDDILRSVLNLAQTELRLRELER